jgi:hypothetical protein
MVFSSRSVLLGCWLGLWSDDGLTLTSRKRHSPYGQDRRAFGACTSGPARVLLLVKRKGPILGIGPF